VGLGERARRATHTSLLAAMLLAAVAPHARACNACLEDKIAATYDWQVVSAAQARGHTIVFTAIAGKVKADDPALAKKLARQIGAVRGVDPGTPRVSLSPPAASFSFDPAHGSALKLLKAINQTLAPSGLSLRIVRVGAPGAAAVAVVPR